MIFLSFKVEALPKKSICLNMIVKNESPIICRCLASVKPLIDYWVIVDTGSTDGTQTIIKNFMKEIPGELHERPWINFAHNRNEALELAKGKADYLLFIDADEVFLYSKEFIFPPLDKDDYSITTEFSGTKYHRVQLINNHLNWKWVGVLHEFLESPEAKSHGILKGITNFVRTDGDRSKDPEKFLKDALTLEKALIDEPNNSRYVFYLAQSYKDAEKYELALKNYQKRVTMGGWDQEVFWSLLQIGLMQEALKNDEETIVNSFTKAFHFRPARAEPLYRLANFYRNRENYLAGYSTALQGLTLRSNHDSLFVEQWIYDYGLLLEFSVCAYWIKKYPEALLASYLLLANPKLPSHIKEHVQRNLVWIHAKLDESKSEEKEVITSSEVYLNSDI